MKPESYRTEQEEEEEEEEERNRIEAEAAIKVLYYLPTIGG